MPTPQQRSRSLRKIVRKAPGGRLLIHYEKKKPKKAHCSTCGKQLAGVPRERSTKMRNLGKTEKRPERMFGGVKCGQCVRRMLMEKARGMYNA